MADPSSPARKRSGKSGFYRMPPANGGAFLARADGAQVIERINAGVVSVVPVDADRV
jgi:hypothetical protein